MDASGVTSLDPVTAVVSLVNPEDLSSVRASFCSQVHFFASPAAAEPWAESHPSGTVLPVAEAYRLASSLAQKMLNPDVTPTACNSGPGTRCC